MILCKEGDLRIWWIPQEGDAITMYAGKKICRRTKDKPYCQNRQDKNG